MKKYLVVYRAGETFKKSYSETEQLDIRSDWQDWMEVISQHVISASPVTRAGSVLANGVRSTPIEDEHLVNGYMLLKAKDLEGAIEICEQCPLYLAGKVFEIRELPDA